MCLFRTLESSCIDTFTFHFISYHVCVRFEDNVIFTLSATCNWCLYNHLSQELHLSHGEAVPNTKSISRGVFGSQLLLHTITAKQCNLNLKTCTMLTHSVCHRHDVMSRPQIICEQRHRTLDTSAQSASNALTVTDHTQWTII